MNEQPSESALPSQPAVTDLEVWFAQQGSIYVFVVLIFVYVKLMNRLDQEFDVSESEGI